MIILSVFLDILKIYIMVIDLIISCILTFSILKYKHRMKRKVKYLILFLTFVALLSSIYIMEGSVI